MEELGAVVAQGERFVLGRDGKWTGPNPTLVTILNNAYLPDQRASACDAVVPWGYDAVLVAAEDLGGKPEFPPRPESSPGLIH